MCVGALNVTMVGPSVVRGAVCNDGVSQCGLGLCMLQWWAPMRFGALYVTMVVPIVVRGAVCNDGGAQCGSGRCM
jgi:hypothetical protein